MSMVIVEASDSEEETSSVEDDEWEEASEAEVVQDDDTRIADAHEVEALAAPSDHSYLNASHPLLPDNSSFQRDYRRPKASLGNDNNDEDSTMKSSTRVDNSFELAVLVLNGVVLFPGSTIPIKLHNRSMIQYLGRQIQQCRTRPDLQPKVELGILTYTEEVLDEEFNADRIRALNPYYSRMLLRRQNQYRPPAQNSLYSQGSGNISGTASIRHPYIDRIGTIATVRHTHERAGADSSDGRNNNSGTVWSQYEDATELVLTAVGTSRFRVVDVVDEQRSVFCVQELVDDSMARPFPRRLFSSNPLQVVLDGNDLQFSRWDEVAWNVAQVTPLPYFVHHKFSPWAIMEKIRGVLRSNAGRNNLPLLGAEGRTQNYLEPTGFSFWIANNVPLKESERLNLLEIHSTLERLRIVWDVIQKLVKKPSVICCADCESVLSFTNDVFTVGGAEGSTSTYVNGGGYIHQITTLRSLVDENKVVFEGYPSTENSYFPGYSWHITRCRRCAALLGWKFRNVGRVDDSLRIAPEDRPDTFFGFMSSIVTTKQIN